MERFIRRENVAHYRDMLTRAKTDAERQQLQKLLDEELKKQVEAHDFDKPGGKPVK
ncbi:hypothetical protein [Rhodoplanes sp. Z2-YC6860]|uniref:hypothetical protein n=1 Tax=Rhodoplanes sp. Z2-YC6860 TaxID=674703 RepID=UPI0012ED82DC|nr:hypothetical protein [Rhodoplanes sp. Z2-YC6860]